LFFQYELLFRDLFDHLQELGEEGVRRDKTRGKERKREGT
jgi:hypothetical protein